MASPVENGRLEPVPLCHSVQVIGFSYKSMGSRSKRDDLDQSTIVRGLNRVLEFSYRGVTSLAGVGFLAADNAVFIPRIREYPSDVAAGFWGFSYDLHRNLL